MDRETELMRALAALQTEYRIKAQPLIDELVKIAVRKPPFPPVFIYDQIGPLGRSVAGEGALPDD